MYNTCIENEKSELIMKIVIQTQFRENYGAHDWDGTGECPQYWKSKGGSTYFVDCTLAEAQDASYWSELSMLINQSDDYSAEYIISQDLVDAIDFDASNFCEDWETPIYMERTLEGVWVAQSSMKFDEYMPAFGILKRKVSSWTQDLEGNRSDAQTSVETCEGEWMSYQESIEYFTKVKEAA